MLNREEDVFYKPRVVQIRNTIITNASNPLAHTFSAATLFPAIINTPNSSTVDTPQTYVRNHEFLTVLVLIYRAIYTALRTRYAATVVLSVAVTN
jgi:hypothetical protein